jgi:5-methylcytosine-specific restriction endonuclease McrA
MQPYDLSHLSGAALDDEMIASAAHDCSSTAKFLARIAEYDVRKRYLSAGYPSMFAYCVERLHLSDDAAVKRIQAARAARQYPALFDAVADGRLHLTAVRLLASHLTPENMAELIEAATHRRCSEIEEMLERRFVRLETLMEGSRVQTDRPPTRVAPDDVALMVPLPAPGQVESRAADDDQPAPRSEQPATGPEPSVWVALTKRAHAKLQYAQALLCKKLPSGDASLVLERALDDLIAREEKSKFAATDRPRRMPDRSSRARHVPARVKRAVWKRDGGRCTFVSDGGKRCGARKFLEFDHVTPVARGGRASVEGMRLRCRGHNQYEAERAFGGGFMQRKREQARERVERAMQARRAKPG